jgi:SAM-dependent methyltransferase
MVISLGELPLGNITQTREGADEERFPLELCFCDTCTLVQIRQAIPSRELLEQNLYFTSASPAVMKHHREMAAQLGARFGLGPSSVVVEVGSNDGTMLARFKDGGMHVVGIEPTARSAQIAEEQHGIPTVVDLFTHDLGRRLADERPADLFVSNYVLELVPDVGDFIRGVRDLLAPRGVAVLEVPYVRSMVERGRFDGIAHLRLTWFSATSFNAALERQGLVMSDVEYLPEYRGGTLRVYASRDGLRRSAAVAHLLALEQSAGVDRPDFYLAFNARIPQLCASIREFVIEARRAGKTVAGYGAGVKASTLLNVAGLDRTLIDFVVDANPQKQGRVMPGVHIPVFDPERLCTERPDYVLILALDMSDEVLATQQEYRRRGGRFVVPVPELCVR